MQLDNLDDLNNKLLKKEFDRTLTTNTKFILQAELRQNYFHAIESFFEIFFALIPDGEKVPDNTNIVQRLVKSNWRKNYNKITVTNTSIVFIFILNNYFILYINY